jgi:hypothetical protein
VDHIAAAEWITSRPPPKDKLEEQAGATTGLMQKVVDAASEEPKGLHLRDVGWELVAGLTHGPQAALATGAADIASRMSPGPIGTAAGLGARVAGYRPALSALGDAGPETAAALRVLQKTNGDATDTLDDHLGKMLNDLPAFRGSVADKLTKVPTADIANRIAMTQALASDPGKLIEATGKALGDLPDHAPKVAGEAAGTMARAVSYLANKAPAIQPASAINPKPEPSRMAALEWEHIARALQDPLHADYSDPDVMHAIRPSIPNWPRRPVQR